MKKKLIIIFFSILLAILFSIVGLYLFYSSGLKAVSSKSQEVKFMVDSGSTYYSVASKLKKEGLIRNELCFKLYVKLNKVNKLEAGSYKLNKNMSVKEIIEVFKKGNTYNPDAIVITFREGKNMRSVAKDISDYTNNTQDDVYNTLNDKEYLNSLIDKYWFIGEEILDERIYYSLEGYLYPNTYEFKNKDVTVEEIFNTMLDEMEKQLNRVKDEIENSKYSIHEILTLSSIVELEGSNSDDRNGIAGVFYNRLNANWSLGSDVTTYYASKVELNERDLYKYEIDDANDYNTRSSHLAGKLPIGPICNPSMKSIKAVLEPESNDYYFFVSDKNGKTYFSRTNEEHESTKQDLIEAGLWFNYD